MKYHNRMQMKYITIFFLMFACMLVLNDMSYDDDIASNEFYCANVQAGAWPNFKELDCDDEKMP